MEILLSIVIAVLIVRIIVFAALHVRYPQLSIFKNTVSDYGTGASRSMYSAMGVLSAVAYACLAAVLWLQQVQPTWLIAVLTICTIGSFAILFFATDKTGSSRVTLQGRIHWLLAILNFTLLFVFIANFVPASSAMDAGIQWLTVAVKIIFYSFLVTLIVPALRKKFVGLTERLFLTVVPLWFIAVATALLAVR